MDEHITIEKIKEEISKPTIKYVSFDLFDTLIKMPFSKPEHLYYLLDKYYEEEIYSNVCFHNLRINAVKIALRNLANLRKGLQDVTIDEIYGCINTDYGVDKIICDKLKSKEKSLIFELSEHRASIKEVYGTALGLGKKILIICETNLDVETVETLLTKNGYKEWEDIILSSVCRKNKSSGDLYEFVFQKYLIRSNDLIHIGSDYNKDYRVLQMIGMPSIHIPRPVDQLFDVTDCSFCKELIDYKYLFKSFGFGCLIAIVANNYFDNPFRAFNKESCLNVDPYFLGYYLGMHLLGIVQWILQETSNYERILFMSRDGYIVKKAYDIITEGRKAPKSLYIQISRKMMLPFIINSYADMIEFPSLNIVSANPSNVFELLKFCTKDISICEEKRFCEEINMGNNENFRNFENYQRFINAFYHKLYDESKHNYSKKIIREHFRTVGENDITFDLGNYGRVQSALVKATQKNIDAMFLFSDSEKSFSETRKNKYKIKTFYNFYPSNHRSIREYIFSCDDPSCIGLQLINEKVIPIYDKRLKSNAELNLKKDIHQGALQFVFDYIKKFGHYSNEIVFKPFEVSLPFEAFLRKPNSLDLKMFDEVYFDKMINGKDISIADKIRRHSPIH